MARIAGAGRDGRIHVFRTTRATGYAHINSVSVVYRATCIKAATFVNGKCSQNCSGAIGL